MFGTVVVMMFASAGPRWAGEPERPNIVFIIAT